MTALDQHAKEPRWVAWRNERRGDKLTKVPYCAPDKKAKADDPTTWLCRAEAERVAAKIVNGLGGGVGYELGDLGNDLYIGGIDLDSCLNNGEATDWAAAIMASAPTYGEQSPSGTGLKLFFYLAAEDVRPFLDLIAVLPTQWGCRRDVPGENARDHGPAVEIYLSHRYFAVTEQRWPDLPEQITVLEWEALQRLATLIPPSKSGDNSRLQPPFAKALRCAGRERLSRRWSRHCGRIPKRLLGSVKKVRPPAAVNCEEFGKRQRFRSMRPRKAPSRSTTSTPTCRCTTTSMCHHASRGQLPASTHASRLSRLSTRLDNLCSMSRESPKLSLQACGLIRTDR
jgi:hypothetical protein